MESTVQKIAAAPLAQLAERTAFNRVVAGSSPAGGALASTNSGDYPGYTGTRVTAPGVHLYRIPESSAHSVQC
eukprot:1844297-Rhodomonas_salina.4